MGLPIIENEMVLLVRFAHNWNNGMLELWNDGFWLPESLQLGADNGMVGLENQSEYNCIDILVIVAYFGAKAENACLTGIIIKCSFNIFCRMDLFPLSMASLPTFHYSIIPFRWHKINVVKICVISIYYRNSET
jgi:hypothetical protein